jgi:hypothetical protein
MFACSGGNVPTEIQATNIIQVPGRVDQRNSRNLTGEDIIIKALVPVSDAYLSSTLRKGGQNKRKELEAISHRQEEGNVKDKKHSKKARVSDLPMTSKPPISTNNSLLIEGKKNKRKQGGEVMAKEEGNRIVKGAYGLEIENQEGLLNSPKKFRGEVNMEQVLESYKAMDAVLLANLANSNDIKAQEEVVEQCLKGSMTPLLASLIKPFKWNNIKERACLDARYTYLLLHFPEQVEDDSLYGELFELGKAYAEKGETLWQVNLGYMYRRALGVKVNHRKGYEYYRAAAEQGCAIAQKLLGDMYFGGYVGNVFSNKALEDEYNKSRCKDRLEYNETEAVEWYKKAIEQGYVPAITSVGYAYQAANGMSRRPTLTMRYYKEAAKQGDVQAKYYLGDIYYRGLGASVKPNKEKAYKYFSEAAKEGHAEAQADLRLVSR